MAVACPTDFGDDDERGFTTAGRDHQFDTEAADRGVGTAPRRRKWTLLGGKRNGRRSRALSMPVAPVDLDLDGTETLKAERSFRSPESSEEDEEGSSNTSTSRSGSGERKRRIRIIQARSRDDSESESMGSPVSWC